MLSAEEAGIRLRQRSGWIGFAGGLAGPFVLGVGQTCGVMISVLALPLVVLLATTVPVYVRQSVSDLQRSEIAAARVSLRIGLAVLLVWLVLTNYGEVVAAACLATFVVTMLVFSMAFFVREY